MQSDMCSQLSILLYEMSPCDVVFRMVYCDESVEEGSSVNIHQPTTFAHKNLTLDGAAVFWDEFSESARAGLKSPPPQTVSLSSLFVLKNFNIFIDKAFK